MESERNSEGNPLDADAPTAEGGYKVNIIRNRFVVMRKNRSEVWCGLAKRFYFKPVSEVNDTSIKTYRSESQAESGCSSWDRNFEVVPAKEIIVINPMTNADRIRSMSDEELAKWLDNFFWGNKKVNPFDTLKWLRQPVEEDS